MKLLIELLVFVVVEMVELAWHSPRALWMTDGNIKACCEHPATLWPLLLDHVTSFATDPRFLLADGGRKNLHIFDINFRLVSMKGSVFFVSLFFPFEIPFVAPRYNLSSLLSQTTIQADSKEYERKNKE